jgi:hypothetical protein
MFYKNEDEDDIREEIISNIDEASALHTKNILNEDYDKVAFFLNNCSDRILEMIDEIEDDELAIKLTTFVGAVLGGVGKACLDLKSENAILKHDILTELQGDVDPKLN